jgi:DGQHR domain-containing protein
MPRGRRKHTLEDADELIPDSAGEMVSYTASLITQGSYRFYTLSMPSDVLALTCTVDTQEEDPEAGFQRRLDEKRASNIADYIDKERGTIPTAIVLSAQPESKFEYSNTKRTVRFQKHPKAFLIIDGQHRVYGFRLATTNLRVPVIIYSNLSKSQEARLFVDINTKQRPVPNELLLAIKRLAQMENSQESLMRDIFDAFDKSADSPLLGYMSSSERKKSKLSRVTFNAALKPIFSTFEDSDLESVYSVLGNYLHAWLTDFRSKEIEEMIVNPILFRAILLLFPAVAERVADRYGENYSADNFFEVLQPVFSRTKVSNLKAPGKSPIELFDTLRKQLDSGFSLRRGGRR